MNILLTYLFTEHLDGIFEHPFSSFGLGDIDY